MNCRVEQIGGSTGAVRALQSMAALHVIAGRADRVARPTGLGVALVARQHLAAPDPDLGANDVRVRPKGAENFRGALRRRRRTRPPCC